MGKWHTLSLSYYQGQVQIIIHRPTVLFISILVINSYCFCDIYSYLIDTDILYALQCPWCKILNKNSWKRWRVMCLSELTNPNKDLILINAWSSFQRQIAAWLNKFWWLSDWIVFVFQMSLHILLLANQRWAFVLPQDANLENVICLVLP